MRQQRGGDRTDVRIALVLAIGIAIEASYGTEETKARIGRTRGAGARLTRLGRSGAGG